MCNIEEIASRLDDYKTIIEVQNSFSPEVAIAALDEMKVLLTKCEYLSLNSRSLPKYDRLLFREILELGVILCVRTSNLEGVTDNNTKSIWKFYQQLKFFYFENDDIPVSERMFSIIATSLLAIYSMDATSEEDKKRKIVDFQTDLARVEKKYKRNMHISFVLDVEQAVTDNKLTQISDLQKIAPSTLFAPFMEKLVIQVKENLCRDVCSQCDMKVSELAKLLGMRSYDQCKDFLIQKKLYNIDNADRYVNLKLKSKVTTEKTPAMKQDDVIKSAKHFNDL